MAGHQKAAGISLLVRYPGGFYGNGHMDGQVIQEFTGKSGEREVNLTLRFF